MDKDEIKDFFSEFWEIDKEKINDDLKLDSTDLSNQSSIRLFQFFAALESNFGLKVKNLNKIKTFGDLVANVM